MNLEISYICPLYFSLLTRQAKACLVSVGKDEVAGSNPGISSRSLAEMQDFFVVLGWFVQELARSPSFCETSLLFAPDLSQIVSQNGRFLSSFFYYMRAKMEHHKIYHKE